MGNGHWPRVECRLRRVCVWHVEMYLPGLLVGWVNVPCLARIDCSKDRQEREEGMCRVKSSVDGSSLDGTAMDGQRRTMVYNQTSVVVSGEAAAAWAILAGQQQQCQDSLMYLEANGAHDHPTLKCYYYYVKLCVWVAGAMSELCTWTRNYVCHLLGSCSEKEVVVVGGHPGRQEKEEYFSNILKFIRNWILLCGELLTEYIN